MNSAHDLGGMDGLGPIDREENEPVFHAEWERRVFALTVGMGFYGAWNLDASRHARERIPAAEYLTSSYYEIWLAGLERLLDETGLLTRAEIETRVAALRAEAG
jgi:nitrile hydratase subunit beta